jgi:dolichol-phosphate mannosyltransferase
MPLHSLVIPVFNERPGLDALFERVKGVFDALHRAGDTYEAILVNDGSRDGSTEKLDELARADRRFKVVHLSRNFGHQVAITAGIEWARGETVTVIDADLQDPPELLEQLIAKWREGFEVVYATRESRQGESAFKLWTAKLFYRLIRWLTHVDIPLDTGDFRLMDRKAVDAFLRIPERHRFVRGLVSWVGYRQTGVPYKRASRVHGETHYPFKKMLKFALDGITSFSIFPLQIATYVGFVSAVVAFFGILYTLYLRLLTDKTIQGWTSLMIVVLFLGGVQLLALGIIGEYLGRTYDETRRRPLYFVGRVTGFELGQK